MAKKLSEISEKKEGSKKQDLIDEIIKLSIKKGNKKFAEKIASLGGASKKTIEQEILPIFKEEAKNLSPDLCSYYGLLETVNILAFYGIRPVGLVDKVISFFLENKSYHCAMYLAENGSAKMKKIAKKTALKKGFKEIEVLNEAICLKIGFKNPLSIKDLSILKESLKEYSPIS